MNSLSATRIHYGFNISYAYLLWFHYFFHEFQMNSLSATRIHYDFCISYANSQWIHSFFCEFTINSRKLTKNPLSVTLIHNGFTIFFTIDLIIFTQICYEFTIIYANLSSLSRILYLLRKLTMNFPSYLRISLFFPRIYYEFTFYFTILFRKNYFFVDCLCIQYLFLRIPIDFSRIRHESIMFLAN